MLTICKKETKLFFVTMQGYVFIFMMLIAIGAVCFAYNFIAGYSDFQNVLSFMSMFLIFAIPILTMRTFSEERKQRTDQLLYTLPFESWQIVLGKYLALLIILAVPIAIMCFYPWLLSWFGTIDLRTSYCSILAMYFLGTALCAIGMFLSSLTENQLVSAVLSFGVLFFCYEAGNISDAFTPGALQSYAAFIIVALVLAAIIFIVTRNLTVGLIAVAVLLVPLVVARLIDFTIFTSAFCKVIDAFAIFDKMSEFIQGIFNVSSLVYFVTVSLVFLFFTTKVIECRRYR